MARLSRRITAAVADPYSQRSLSGRSRARRWERFLHRFPKLEDMRVLDMGGHVNHWADAPVPPGEVVIVNLFEQKTTEKWLVPVVGDACNPPSELDGEQFDLTYSNSVIEHVGGHISRANFAEVARTRAPHHWAQTPYRYFPLEPHWLFPLFQFLPPAAKAAVTRRWPIGHMGAAGSTALEHALGVDLLTLTEMRHYFPESQIIIERVGPMPKSLIAVR